ncbi:aromatic ring-hydroxylating oxygenase subunit alpha [Lysinibacillus sp. NPDC093216]|uniref:aromatic ring-hydroxylating oxygenase subunit alpha n=1 Tax=Lysinibacillus sp. NPDC093216 TaxID=3390576 RepID=UPI003D02F68B
MTINTFSNKANATLSYKNYVEQQYFDEEKENIFSKKWVFVGHMSQLEKVGDFFTFEIAGESIIVSKNNDGKVNAFYNICPHRGTRVEKSASGNKKVFLCSYHGWSFKLNGKVNRAPNFDKDSLGDHNCMTPVKLEIYQSLIFVNLDPNAKSFQSEYSDLVESLDQYKFLNALKRIRTTQRVIEANWKAVVDNYLECDHCKLAHPAFAKTFDLENYNIDTFNTYTCQYSEMKQGEEADPAFFYWVWPNLMISIYPGEEGNITTSQILPISPNQSLAIYSYYFSSDKITDKQEELIKFVDQVRKEDFDLVELLQTGLHTKAFDHGIYSPTEHGIKHFHKQYKEAMGIPE